MSGFGLNKTVTANVTPSTIVFFDKVTPTTAGVVFDPNTPATTDILYISSVDASTWIWDGSDYVTYAAPSVSSTEWYLYGTTIDAGSNKTASIQRSGAIFVNVDSYFYDVRVGRGNGSIGSNTIVGDKCLLSNTTGAKITAVGAGALQFNTASNNTAVGWGSLTFNSSGTNNTGVGSEALLRNVTGSNNSAIGYQAGEFLANGSTSNTTPENSVFLGYSTRSLTNNDTNQIVIGYLALGKGSNTVQLGNTSITATYLQGEVNINPVSGQISRAIINSDNNVGALLSFRTANLPRWAIRKDGNETGANVGGDLAVRRYDDAGAFIDTPISIKRSTGAVTLNSAYALPTTDGTATQSLVTNGAGVVSWVDGGSAIPQANTIYVDSVNGVNATTGRGDINKPYLTPEYALGNITNTGTVTATTTSTSATLTAVSDTTNIKVGQYITGTGIPYASIVVSKTINTIVLSKACTANATITATWWTVYNVILVGSFVVTSSLAKAGFWIDAKTYKSTITFGAINLFLFPANVNIPHFISLNDVQGTSVSSILMGGAVAYIQLQDLYFEFNNYYSIGTSYQIGDFNNLLRCVNFFVKGNNYDARFGYVNKINATNTYWDVNYTYGLLGGHMNSSNTGYFKGELVCPTSVTALVGGTNTNYYGNISGNISSGSIINIYGNINSTTITITNGGAITLQCNLYGNVTATTFSNGSMTAIYGNFTGTFNNSGTYNQFTSASFYKMLISTTITITNGVVTYNGAETTSGSATINLNGGRFINQGILNFSIITVTAGTFENKSELLGSYINLSGAGVYINNGVTSVNVGTNNNYAGINIASGSKLVNNGTITYPQADTTVNATISKTDGTFINNGFIYNPWGLFCKYVANTTASKNIILGYARSNGNGTTSSASGTGNINRLVVTLANTDTSITINDGYNTVTFNVIGAGKSVANIVDELVVAMRASVLLRSSINRNTASGYLIYIEPPTINLIYTSLTNITNLGPYSGGGGFGGNILGGGTELTSELYIN